MNPAGFVLMDPKGNFVDYRDGAFLDLHPYDRWAIEVAHKRKYICGVSNNVSKMLRDYYRNVRFGIPCSRPQLKNMARITNDAGTTIICTPAEDEFEEVRELMATAGGNNLDPSNTTYF